MENINKIIEKNTWNFTRSPGDGHFCYCRHVYFHCYCIYEHACVSSRGAQSTELVSLNIGYWTLNNYYYYYVNTLD